MAIAYDNTTGTSENPVVGTLDLNHTTSTGSNRMLLFFGFDNMSGACTGSTYNGSALTIVGAKYFVAANVYIYIYSLVAPSTGTNAFQSSYSSSASSAAAVVMTYTGVDQNNPTNSTGNKGTSVTTLTSSLTVSANSWLATSGRGNSSGDVTAGTGSTERFGTAGFIQTFDSNAALGAGSQSMQLNGGTESTFAMFIVELKEASGGGAVNSGFLSFM